MNKCAINVAVEEAEKASLLGEIPVGCVILYKNKIIAKAHNMRNELKSVFGHAEVLAIKEANLKLNDWRLSDCEMYVTLEPCDMCKAIIEESRIKKVYYMISKNKNSNLITIYNKIEEKNIIVDKIMKDFFKKMRKYK